MDEKIDRKLRLKYQGIPTKVDLVQATNAMVLVFVLADYQIPDGATARIYVRKPSGKEVYNEGQIEDNSIIVKTTTQMTAETGENRAQLQIVNGSIVAASFVFYLYVQPNIIEDTAIESSNEYGVLDGLIQETKDLIEEAKDAIGGVEPVNNLTSTDASKPLAAPMGKLLDDKITDLNASLVNKIGVTSLTSGDLADIVAKAPVSCVTKYHISDANAKIITGLPDGIDTACYIYVTKGTYISSSITILINHRMRSIYLGTQSGSPVFAAWDKITTTKLS